MLDGHSAPSLYLQKGIEMANGLERVMDEDGWVWRKAEFCEECGNLVEMMSQRGTGLCSRNCEKARERRLAAEAVPEATPDPESPSEGRSVALGWPDAPVLGFRQPAPKDDA